MDNTTKQRAYDIAKGWLSDPEWIAAHLERIAPHASQALAKCFKDIGDDEISLRQFYVNLQVEITHFHAVLIEVVFWPEAVHKAEEEQLVRLEQAARIYCGDDEPFREVA